MDLVFSLDLVGLDHLCSTWCWLILLSWGQRIQDGVTHVWFLCISCWLVFFRSLPCGSFFFPCSLSLLSILAHSFLKTCFLASKNGEKNDTRSLKTQAPAQITCHPFCLILFVKEVIKQTQSQEREMDHTCWWKITMHAQA